MASQMWWGQINPQVGLLPSLMKKQGCTATPLLSSQSSETQVQKMKWCLPVLTQTPESLDFGRDSIRTWWVPAFIRTPESLDFRDTQTSSTPSSTNSVPTLPFQHHLPLCLWTHPSFQIGSRLTVQKYIPLLYFKLFKFLWNFMNFYEILWKIPNTYKSTNNSTRKPHGPFHLVSTINKLLSHPCSGLILKQILDIISPTIISVLYTEIYSLSVLSCTSLVRYFPSTPFTFPNSISSNQARLGLSSYTVSPLNLWLSLRLLGHLSYYCPVIPDLLSCTLTMSLACKAGDCSALTVKWWCSVGSELSNNLVLWSL